MDLGLKGKVAFVAGGEPGFGKSRGHGDESRGRKSCYLRSR